MASDKYEPKPEHKFSFGLWTVGNPGRDPFGEPVRAILPPTELVRLLGEVGAWGVNLHDNDLVPIDASPAERDRIVREFKAACQPKRHRRCPWPPSIFLPTRSFATALSPPTILACAPTRVQKTHARHGSGRGAGRKDFCFVGRPRRHGNRRLPPSRRSRQAPARRRELSLRIFHLAEIRLQIRPGSQAQRAARRHLYGHHRRISRLHRHPRSSRMVRRESRSRARDRWPD